MSTAKFTLGVFVILLSGAGIVANATPNFTARQASSTMLPAGFREAQRAYRMSSSKGVVMMLSGTTPVRNWSMSAHGISGEANIVVTSSDRLSNIVALRFSLPVHNLKGDGDGMDKDAYKALKADIYPTIDFQLASATIEERGNDLYLVHAHGNLSVAGVTHDVTLEMMGALASDGSITFHGAQDLKMSDYNVERPSLLLGLIKAGDAIRLTYTLIFIK